MPAFTHHVFVCGNTREPGHKRGCCDPTGKQELRDAFRKALKTAGVTQHVRINHAGCLDQCEHGPTVVIYPGGTWYGGVRPEDAQLIVKETIVGGRVVDDLLIPDECLNNPECPHHQTNSDR